MTYFTTTTSLQNYEKDMLAEIDAQKDKLYHDLKSKRFKLIGRLFSENCLKKYEQNTLAELQKQKDELYCTLDDCYKDRLRNDVELAKLNNKTVKYFYQIVYDNYNELENQYETVSFLNDNLIFALDIGQLENYIIDIPKDSKYFARTPYGDIYCVNFKKSVLVLQVRYYYDSDNDKRIENISISQFPHNFFN